MPVPDPGVGGREFQAFRLLPGRWGHVRAGSSEVVVEWVWEEGILTRRGRRCSLKERVVHTGARKIRCLPRVCLHVPQDLPRIWMPVLNHLADLTVILDFFFLPASCQLQALIIIILQLACPSASYSSVNLSLTQLRSPGKDPVFETAEGWAVNCLSVL